MAEGARERNEHAAAGVRIELCTRIPLPDELRALVEIARADGIVIREEGSGTLDALEQIVAERLGAGVTAPAIELGTTAAVRSAIVGGLAPGVLRRLLVRDDLVLGRLVAVPVGGAPLIRPLHAVRPRGRSSAAVQRLIDCAFLS